MTYGVHMFLDTENSHYELLWCMETLHSPHLFVHSYFHLIRVPQAEYEATLAFRATTVSDSYWLFSRYTIIPRSLTTFR